MKRRYLAKGIIRAIHEHDIRVSDIDNDLYDLSSIYLWIEYSAHLDKTITAITPTWSQLWAVQQHSSLLSLPHSPPELMAHQPQPQPP